MGQLRNAVLDEVCKGSQADEWAKSESVGSVGGMMGGDRKVNGTAIETNKKESLVKRVQPSMGWEC